MSVPAASAFSALDVCFRRVHVGFGRFQCCARLPHLGFDLLLSSSASNCPAFTRSPASTYSFFTMPLAFDLISTLVWAQSCRGDNTLGQVTLVDFCQLGWIDLVSLLLAATTPTRSTTSSATMPMMM